MTDYSERLSLASCLEKPFQRPATERQPKLAHVFERDSVLAVNMALACRRPLLVRGEPGAGKSQLARAVAAKLGRVFLSVFVHARTEAHDLLWFHDAVARLAEAHIWATVPEATREDARIELSRRRFVVPGPLWWALNWDAALEQNGQCHVKKEPPASEEEAQRGAVLLIDEIDKADNSVPNGLLESLGRGTFSVPGLDRPVRAAGPHPLVVLTTNDDRVLPDAFVRRCVVLYLRLPERDERASDEERDRALIHWLVERGQAHFQGLDVALLEKAAAQVARDRAAVQGSGHCPPGLAEYIDLVTAMVDHPLGTEDAAIEELAPFVMHKHADPGPRTAR